LEIQVIILDEPFANLDPNTQFRLKKIIKELAADPNVTILVSSHDLLHTVEVSDRIVAMHKASGKGHSNFTRNITKLEQFFAV
jgi:ABC-2 type transport system ATP-binding protein